jgi:hypothetical protein
MFYDNYDHYPLPLDANSKIVMIDSGNKNYLLHTMAIGSAGSLSQRALRDMGYTVHRVGNDRIMSAPYAVAADIIQKYYEIVDAEDRTAKIKKLKNTAHESIPKDLAKNLPFWAIEFNKELNDERWTADIFKESLKQFHLGLVSNQCAMERLILLLVGLNLRKTQDGISLDFEYSSNLLKNGIEIIRSIFGGVQGDAAAIHLRNMYNISAPGFFKNLIFKGGPNLNPGVIKITDKFTLDSIVDNFNKSFSDLGITVESSEIKSECNALLKRFDKGQESAYSWLVEWMDNIS